MEDRARDWAIEMRLEAAALIGRRSNPFRFGWFLFFCLFRVEIFSRAADHRHRRR